MKKLSTVGFRFTTLLVVAVQLSCGDGPSEPAPVATTITANSPTTLTGTAGAPVATPPSVIVRDQNGNPMAGIAVGFTVGSGGGSLAGAAAVTNSLGVATVGSWTLGTTAGSNSLSATAGTLAAVVFTATGTAGPAAVVVKTAGDNQTADDGTAVAVPPAVTVRDANGNPVAGVGVIFAVGMGGGTVSSGSQVTDASGVATVGSWTLGATGPNTLTATAGSLAVVTFTATATARAACSDSTPHTFGTTSNGELTTTDCRTPDGFYIDYFSTTVSPAGAYAFSQSGSFDTFLILYGPDGFAVGFNDDETPGAGQPQPSRIKALLPSANYFLGATSWDPGITGTYTLSSAATSAVITGCEEVFVARGVSTDQNLQTTDCLFSGFYSDDMLIFLRAGQAVTISMNSTALDAYLELYNTSGTLVASNDDRDATTNDARIAFTPTANGFFLVVPTSSVAGATGAYTLIIQ